MDMADAVSSSLNMVRDRAMKAGIKIVVENLSPHIIIDADPIRVKQILINLLTNSIKFTPPKGEVKLKYNLNKSGGLDIIVSDTGIGIEADQLKTILERFGQVRGSQISSHDGIGLGLPISKSIIELHGGSLVVESKVGVGTKVTVSFPSSRVILDHIHDPAHDQTKETGTG
jgi:signal transduction histidine kinase